MRTAFPSSCAFSMENALQCSNRSLVSNTHCSSHTFSPKCPKVSRHRLTYNIQCTNTMYIYNVHIHCIIDSLCMYKTGFRLFAFPKGLFAATTGFSFDCVCIANAHLIEESDLDNLLIFESNLSLIVNI